MFDASYLALMRELRLEREFEEGDWYVVQDDDGATNSYCFGSSDMGAGRTHERRLGNWSGRLVWLPRLDQWLAKLEEAGEPGITFVHDARFGYSAQIVRRSPIWCSSYEESCARLWVVLTGRTVGADA